jgi:tetratricopeptide (TPR) repeat protein
MPIVKICMSEQIDFNYAEILKLYEIGDINTALEISKRLADSNVSANLLDILVCLYIDLSDFELALEYAKESYKIRENIGDKANENDLATSLNNLGEVYRRRLNENDLENAKEYAERALEIRERICSKASNNDLATSLNNLAGVYESLGELDKAEGLYIRALQIRKNLYLDKPSRYLATTLNDIGYLYESTEQYPEAEEKYREATKIFEEVFQDRPNDNLAASLSNLAGACRRQKKWSEVESLYQKSLDIRRKIFVDRSSLSLFQSYNNLGGYYREQGKLAKSKEFFTKALATLEDLGYFGQDLASCYNNLAKLYHTQGELRKSDLYFNEAIKTLKINKSYNKSLLAKFYNNLGELYFEKNKLLKAEEYYCKSLNIYDSGKNKVTNDYAQICSNIADIHFEQGNFCEAEKGYNKCLEIRCTLFQNNDNNDLSISYRNLAKLYIRTDKLSSALDCMTKALTIQNNWLRNLFAYSSESQRLLYVKQAQQTLEQFLSLICQYYSNDIDAVKSAFNAILQRKSLATEVAAVFNYTLCSNHYPNLYENSDQLLELQQKIGVMSTETTPREEIHQLREDRDRLQRDLAALVPEIARDNREISAEKISEFLPNDSLFIELIRVKWFNFNASKNHKRRDKYLAFSMIKGQIKSLRIHDLGDATLYQMSRVLRVATD